MNSDRFNHDSFSAMMAARMEAGDTAADACRNAELEAALKTKLARRGDALASVVLAGAAMPDDLREMADRLGVGHVMWQVWLAAYQAGWRAAAAGICPKAVNGIDGLVLEMPGIDPR